MLTSCSRNRQTTYIFNRTDFNSKEAISLNIFLVYINNLPTVSSILHSVLLGEYTCLTLADGNYLNLVNTFISELKKLYALLIKSILSLNFENTVYINFSQRKCEGDQTLQLNGICFSEVDRTK